MQGIDQTCSLLKSSKSSAVRGLGLGVEVGGRFNLDIWGCRSRWGLPGCHLWSLSCCALRPLAKAGAEVGTNNSHQQVNGFVRNGGGEAGALPSAERVSLMRIFYPTASKETNFSLLDVKNRSWLPNVNYFRGFVTRALLPSTPWRRFLGRILSYIIYPFFFPCLPIQASVKQPSLLPGSNLNKDRRLPVVIFSHGMWACRTTYTTICVDLASHGYIVLDVEHLDGSAVMAQYHDHKGKQRWVEFAYSDIGFDDATHERPLGSIETATAVAVCNVDKRFKCCVAEDVWWVQMEEADIERAVPDVPVLLLNTENFDSPAIKDNRNKFLAARARADGDSALTELMTMKGAIHMDQSDFPLLFSKALKRTGVLGKLDVRHSKDINSRASLDFFYKNLLPPGTRAPYLVDVVKEDGEHLIAGTVPGRNGFSAVKKAPAKLS